MFVHNTDKHIGGGIYLAASSLFTPRYKGRTLMAATIVNRSIDQFRRYLDFPKDIRVRIAPIKGNTDGRYNNHDKLVELDCRMSWNKILEVFAHELVHAEQYHQGTLVKKFESSRGWVHYWNGQAGSRGTTYRAYRNQPWEQEAWSRQAELAEQVCRDLERIYG